MHPQDSGQPAIDGARMLISFDDGATWRSRPVRQVGDGRLEVNVPGAPARSAAVSVRVEAWDIDGNTVDQTIIRAWHLPDRR